MRMSAVLEPSACRYCGIPKRMHGRQWDPIPGWHVWKMPYRWQIKDRMKARRNLEQH